MGVACWIVVAHTGRIIHIFKKLTSRGSRDRIMPCERAEADELQLSIICGTCSSASVIRGNAHALHHSSDRDAALNPRYQMLYEGNAAKRISPKRRDVARVQHIQIVSALVRNSTLPSSNHSSCMATTVSRQGPQSMAAAWASVPSQYRSRPVCVRLERSDGSMSAALPSFCRLNCCCRQSAKRGRASSGEGAWARRSTPHLRTPLLARRAGPCYRDVAASKSGA